MKLAIPEKWLEELRELDEKKNVSKWIFHSHNPSYSPFDGSPSDFYRCSNCGYVTGNQTNYCPKCGKKMT